MKNIYLIGDSIRMGATTSPGYGVYVVEKLKGRANVYFPGENCRFAQYTLRYLHDWTAHIDKASIDIVHWNNGLWDLLHLFDDGPLTPMECYTQLLERVYKRIRFLFPNARVIFATTTPVLEKWASPDFYRSNAEIRAYNAAATELMERLGVEIDDLYAVADAQDPEKIHSDFVHFNTLGSELLADAVIKSLGL